MRVDAVVVGAGPAGLATAMALRGHGMGALVVDRMPGVADRGAAIALWANGIEALRALGLAEQALRGRARIASGAFRNWRGDLLATVPMPEVAPEAEWPMVAIERSELQSILLKGVGPEAVRLDAALSSFRQERDRVVVELSDGQQVEAGLLVGADGVHSTVRRSMTQVSRARFAGVRAWVGIAEAPGPASDRFEHLAAPRGGAFWVPLGCGRAFWGLVVRRRHATLSHPRSGGDDIPPRFATWWPPLNELIRATAPEEIVTFDVWEAPPLRSYTEGRVVLIGDAAHAMVPHLAQGTCQALEDAVVLGRLLGDGGDVPVALRRFDQRRRQHTLRVSRLSRRYARSLGLHEPVVRFMGGGGASGRLRRMALSPMRALVSAPHCEARSRG